jgi:serine/threonine protein kinase
MSDDNSSNWRQVQEIFSAVADLPPLQQEKKIDELSCGNDQLKKEVQSLLEFDSNAQIICSAAAENSPYRTGQQIDQFRLAFPLAANAKTEVWKAICDSEPIDSPQRFAAVKILNHTNLQERHQLRFVQEARVLAQFDHSGVAKFMGAGTTPNAHPYVATQFVDGEDIYNYAVGKQLDLRQRIELVISVCKAVEYSHQHLVIHRDLKPENILVDQSGNPVVIDFGISKRLQDEGFNQIELTQTLDRPMTPAYASPEQVRGEPVSAVTDVYSIGLILYQLITGVHPYTDWAHESGTPLFDRITTATPKLPTALIGANLQELSLPGDSSFHFNSHLPAEPQQLKRNLKAGLQFIVMKAIQKSPEDRYQSVAQMRRDLERFNAGKMTSEPAILNTARKNLATSLAIAMICGVALGLLPWLLGLQTTRTTGNEQMSFAAATNQPKQPSFDQQIKIAKRAAHEKNYPLALQIAEDLETGLESVTTSQRFQVANIFFLLGMPQKALATTQLTPSQFATAATKDPQLDKHRHTFCLTLIQCGQADIVRSLNGKSPYETQTRLQQDLVESMIRESNDWHDGVLQILNRIQTYRAIRR